MSEWSEYVLENARCCACEGPLRGSKHLNLVTIDKFASWEFPIWGNLLAKDPLKRTGRAAAICCDGCVDEKTGQALRPIKFAIEVNKLGEEYIIDYHDAMKLKDAPPITAEDLDLEAH